MLDIEDDYLLQIGKISVLYEYVNYEIKDFIRKIYKIEISNNIEVNIKLEKLSSERLHNLYKKTIKNIISTPNDFLKDITIEETLKDLFKRLSRVRECRNDIIHGYCAKVNFTKSNICEVKVENTEKYISFGSGFILKIISLDGLHRIVTDLIELQQIVQNVNYILRKQKHYLEFKDFFVLYVSI